MLSDWTVHKTGSPAVGIMTAITHPTAISPIVNTGSLRVQQFSVSDTLVNLYNNTYTPGKLKARMRSVIRPLSITGITNYSLGFVFMQSQTNLTLGTGSCYFAHLALEAGGTNLRFIIRKFVSTGLQTNLGASTTLYTGSSLGTILGQNTAVEVTWDASSLTSCDITIKYNLNSTSFTGMTTETLTTDSSSPLISSVMESIGVTNGTSSGATDYLIDSTTLVELA
jgi:hypothetical protein